MSLEIDKIKREITSLRNSMRFSAKRLDDLLDELEKVSPVNPQRKSKKPSIRELSDDYAVKIMNS